MITYFQALILGLLQGITELFPISSLGHAVLVANLFNWHNILSAETAKGKNYFLIYLVVIHVATALALFVFYRREWWRIIKGFFRSIAQRTLDDPDARLAWLLLIATIPAGIIALVFQTLLRTQFAKPLSAIVFIIVNGMILLIGDHHIRTHPAPRHRARATSLSSTAVRTSESVTFGRAIVIGVIQVFALIAGISRSGITMIGGIYSGLNREDAARFSFLLATPIILAGGVYELPSVFGQTMRALRGQMLLGALCAAIAAYFAVRYLDRYFKNRTLRPFGIYCIVIGCFMLALGFWRGHF